jgi:NADH dehydrogenase [ubiquinone] 1 alpha subcomplex assembly factor 1
MLTTRSPVLRMQGAEGPSRIPRTLFTFNSNADIQQFATGCDSDIGGTSTLNFDLDESPENNASIGRQATAKFWGDMRLEVRAGLEGKLRGGYAGFRNKVRTGSRLKSYISDPRTSHALHYLGI